MKHQRFERLVDTLNEITAEKNALYQNRTVEVLVEGESARGEAGTWSGRTDTFKLVNFDCDRDLTGQLVNIRITDAKTFSLFGEVADEKEL